MIFNQDQWPTEPSPETGKPRIRKRVASVTIESYPIVHIFYCPDCRFPMFRYQGEFVQIDAGSAPMTVPIEVMCKSCRKVIRIEYLVTDYKQE
jgi:RNase P subunit RPR2